MYHALAFLAFHFSAAAAASSIFAKRSRTEISRRRGLQHQCVRKQHDKKRKHVKDDTLPVFAPQGSASSLIPPSAQTISLWRRQNGKEKKRVPPGTPPHLYRGKSIRAGAATKGSFDSSCCLPASSRRREGCSINSFSLRSRLTMHINLLSGILLLPAIPGYTQ
ncbi:hypothetical protein B0J12DRAFT_267244 [Macrophomina phaseolina]|uniref:Secreted protein n=1 Tax=Macrophomina phaseolina TaxID=35725 RepID=A0ABQ8G1H8_9PEZI|nr:hypothetical protein B0J12DRAFT_267244 [Macrophomina phaseolina]